MLEKVGKTTAILTTDVSVSQIQQMINELVEACAEMSKSKTGALISIERTQSLSDFIRTGIVMDSEVSTELLGTIFQYGTPMHDGAVIIQGNKIACAAAYFLQPQRIFLVSMEQDIERLSALVKLQTQSQLL